MHLLIAFIFAVVWMFGGGYLARKADVLWRKMEQRIAERRQQPDTHGFNPILAQLYSDATQPKPGTGAPADESSRAAPR
jgi:hypothetical protein